MGAGGHSLRACSSLAEIDGRAWDACANPGCRGGAAPAYDPFLSYAFLHALEASGSAVAGTGWAPCHLALEDGSGRLVGAAPLYLKSHSQGEYVFDHGWADAFERAGGRYYPKLLCAVPFTPATGRRLLTAPGPGAAQREKRLLAGMMQLGEQLGVSSVHVIFAERRQWQAMGDLGFSQRTHNQFHWRNAGYGCFDDFLADLSAKKRKNIRRERREAAESGIAIERLTGADITEAHWDDVFRFYMDTGSRKWGRPYLTRDFFSRIGEAMPDDVLLVMCKRGGRYLAGAINFIGGDCLFGRNWGCVEFHPFLHFEVCYYQAIDFAIERGLARVEAGAQGQHKLARGYMPAQTQSAHWIANPAFREAVDGFLASERQHLRQEMEYIAEERSPFRKEQGA